MMFDLLPLISDGLSVFNDGFSLIMTGSGWDLTTFLTNSKDTLEKWFGLVTTLIGIVMIAVSIWQIASGLMSHGKKQTNWPISIILLIVGGAFAGANGFIWVQGIAKGGQKTIDELGNGTGGAVTTPAIMMFDYARAWLNL